jgi:hypothetical protein
VVYVEMTCHHRAIVHINVNSWQLNRVMATRPNRPAVASSHRRCRPAGLSVSRTTTTGSAHDHHGVRPHAFFAESRQRALASIRLDDRPRLPPDDLPLGDRAAGVLRVSTTEGALGPP